MASRLAHTQDPTKDPTSQAPPQRYADMNTTRAVYFVQEGSDAQGDLFSGADTEKAVYLDASDYDRSKHGGLQLFCACCYDKHGERVSLQNRVTPEYTYNGIIYSTRFMAQPGQVHACDVRPHSNSLQTKAAIARARMEPQTIALQLPGFSPGSHFQQAASRKPLRTRGNAPGQELCRIGGLPRLAKLLRQTEGQMGLRGNIRIDCGGTTIRLSDFFSCNAAALAQNLEADGGASAFAPDFFTRALTLSVSEDNWQRIDKAYAECTALDGAGNFVRLQVEDENAIGALQAVFDQAAGQDRTLFVCSPAVYVDDQQDASVERHEQPELAVIVTDARQFTALDPDVLIK